MTVLKWTKRLIVRCHFINFKAHIFWEDHKILQNLHLTFLSYEVLVKSKKRLRKILWPSQNMYMNLMLLIFHVSYLWSILVRNVSNASWYKNQNVSINFWLHCVQPRNRKKSELSLLLIANTPVLAVRFMSKIGFYFATLAFQYVRQ